MVEALASICQIRLQLLDLIFVLGVQVGKVILALAFELLKLARVLRLLVTQLLLLLDVSTLLAVLQVLDGLSLLGRGLSHQALQLFSQLLLRLIATSHNSLHLGLQIGKLCIEFLYKFFAFTDLLTESRDLVITLDDSLTSLVQLARALRKLLLEVRYLGRHFSLQIGR